MNCNGCSSRWPFVGSPLTWSEWCTVCGRMTIHNSIGCTEHTITSVINDTIVTTDNKERE